MSNQPAPVCLIQPVISHDQPPPVNFPAIPLANNLQSALAAINAMRQILLIITGQTDKVVQGPPGRAGAAGKAAPKGGKYSEIKNRRVVNDVRAAVKDDPSSYVQFKRIDGVTMQDNKTKEVWTWTRGPDQ